MKFLSAGLLVFLVCFRFTGSQGINCTHASYGTFCRLQSSPYVTRVVGNQVLVGTINVLWVFSLEQPGLQFNESIALPTDPSEFDFCVQDTLIVPVCQNHVLTVQPLPDTFDKTLVCGSYSLNPACSLHNRYQLSNYTRIPGLSRGYSPYRPVDTIVSILTSNGYFFSATVFTIYTTVTLEVSPGLLVGDTDFNAGTVRNSDLWLNGPKVASAYEYGEYVYFFLYERDVEDPTEIFPRAVRICRTDDGVPSSTDPSKTIFRTFQKARIECSIGVGNSAFHYNYLMSTSLVQREGTTPVLYAVFNPPLNGPPGAAICKFSFNQNEGASITAIFNSRNNRVFMNPSWQVYQEPPYSCPGSPGTQRDPSFSESHILKSSPIRPIMHPIPLFLHSQFLDKVTAEELNYDGDVQEILYIATLTGDIMQVIFSSQNSGTNFRHMLYSAEGSDSEVRSLILDRVDEERNIIATTEDRLIQILRGQCYCYVDCFSCFDSKDPYCSWDANDEICINKILNSHVPDLAQTFTAGDSDIFRYCGPRVFPPVVTDPLFPCTPRPIITTNPTTESTTMIVTESTSEAPTDLFIPSIVSVAQTVQESYTLLVSIGTGLFLAVCITTLTLAIFFRRFKFDELKKVSSIEPAFSSLNSNSEEGEYSSANLQGPQERSSATLQGAPERPSANLQDSQEPSSAIPERPLANLQGSQEPYSTNPQGPPECSLQGPPVISIDPISDGYPVPNIPQIPKIESTTSTHFSGTEASLSSESYSSKSSESISHHSSEFISHHSSESISESGERADFEGTDQSMSSSSDSEQTHESSNLSTKSEEHSTGSGSESDQSSVRRAWEGSESDSHSSLSGRFSRHSRVSDKKKNEEPEYSDLEEFDPVDPAPLKEHSL